MPRKQLKMVKNKKMDYDSMLYAWTDLETTGLDSDLGGVLEVATIITDRFLNEIDTFSTLVYPGKEALSVMPDVVIRMHTENGLLEAIHEPGVPTTKEADQLWSNFLRRHNKGDSKKIIISGNSLGGLDLDFIKKHLPKSDQETHYRCHDVTSFRISAGIWFGNDTNYIKKKSHRAFDDIRECIAEFEYVANKVFTKEK